MLPFLLAAFRALGRLPRRAERSQKELQLFSHLTSLYHHQRVDGYAGASGHSGGSMRGPHSGGQLRDSKEVVATTPSARSKLHVDKTGERAAPSAGRSGAAVLATGGGGLFPTNDFFGMC